MCIQTEQLLSAGRSPSPRYHSLHQHSQPMHPRSSSHSRLPFDDRSPSPPRQRYGQHRYRNGESSLNLLEKWEVYVVVFSESPPTRDYHQMTVREPMLRQQQQQPPRHSAAAARHRPAADFYERGRPVGYPYARSPIYSDDSGSVDEFRRPGYSSGRYQGRLLFIVFEKEFCRRGRGTYLRRAQYDIYIHEEKTQSKVVVNLAGTPSFSFCKMSFWETSESKSAEETSYSFQNRHQT